MIYFVWVNLLGAIEFSFGLVPVWEEHSCINCLLSMHILLPRTSKQEKNLTIFTLFVMALCYVHKCELSYNVLGNLSIVNSALSALGLNLPSARVHGPH